jgi:hypothetical protein
MEDITVSQLELLQHTLGGRRMYRNYFCATPGGEYSKELDVLVNMGLMWVNRAMHKNGGYDFYHCTDNGRRAAYPSWKPSQTPWQD